MAVNTGSALAGSSPRMRGTLRVHHSFGGLIGIIPAYAGNTGTRNIFYKHRGDHPRVCGEHVMMVGSFRLSKGSSPRMRGTQPTFGWVKGYEGIIPAYAGNTCIRPSAVEGRWDHPRVCGEHSKNTNRDMYREGSSPRMRGTHSRLRTVAASRGIIPAYAGNTMTMASSGVRAWDHPRVCGEHWRFVTSGTPPQGSSPRMRGTLFVPLFCFLVNGIIPAYAGNT